MPKSEMDITPDIEAAAQVLWDYNALYEEPQKSDFIIVTGHDSRIVDRGVELFKQGYAPIFIASGGHNYGEVRGIEDSRKEGEVYKQMAIEKGVPKESIFLQTKSKNVGEVFKYVQKIFEQKGMKDIKRGIFVYQPDKQRRGKASLEKQWPEIETVVTSIETTMNGYVSDELPKEELIRQIYDCMDKIIKYPELGFQTEQEIPDDVMKAYEFLKDKGFGAKD